MSDEDVSAAEGGDGVEIPPRRRRGVHDDEDGQSTRRRLMIVLPLVMATAAIAFLVLSGMKDQAISSKHVDALVQQKAKYLGRNVTADGNLVHGTLEKRDQPCEYRFTLSNGGVEMPVRYPQCIVPDLLKDLPGIDVNVAVDGQIQADGSFLASRVVPKCPSKYEMEQKAKSGERMPHMAMEPSVGPGG